MKKPVLNEQINKMRKMMGLNEAEDAISNAKSNAKQQYDFYQDAIDYVGGESEWDKLSGDERDSVLGDMEKDWDRSRNMGENKLDSELFEGGEDVGDFDFEKAAIESASGEKVVQREFDDYDRPLYWSLTNDYVNYFIGDGDNGKMIFKYDAKTGKNTVIGDLKDYDAPEHAKDWGEMEEDDSKEKMVSFDDLLAQDTDGMSPEDQAMIDAHDEEEANKYASKNYDDVESGAIDEIALRSAGIQEFVDYLNDNPAAIAHLGFKNMYSLIDYIEDHGVDDWDQLRTELEAYKNSKTQGHESDPDFDDPIK
jgi:hypothetical protein